jgi:hypothetical protein
MRRAGGLVPVVLLAALLTGMPIAHATTRGWTPTQARGPVSTGTGYHLNAVACWTPGNCVAVGYQSSNGTSGPFIDKESNGSWSYVRVTGVADLTSVSCPAAGACVAVGATGLDTSDPEGLLEVQSGSGWTAIGATGPEGLYPSSTGSLTGVSCPATGSCVAVGQAQSNQEVSTGFLLTLKPGKVRTKPASWVAKKAPEKAGDGPFEDAGLAGVSCVSAGNCRAVGFAHDDSNFSDAIPLIDEEKGYVWAYGGSPAPSGTSFGQLNSVSCVPRSTVCMAAGNYDDNELPFIATINTSTDSSEATGEGLASPFTSEELSATSCAPDRQCQSVGEAFANGGPEYGYNGFIVSEKYGAGSAAATKAATDSPSDANKVEHNETLVSTSCVSGGFCVSVGSYLDNSGPGKDDEASVIDTRTYAHNGSVTSEHDFKAPEPANDKAGDDQKVLLGVSCNNRTHCAAVGSYYSDTEDQARGVIDTLGSVKVKPPTVATVRPSRGKTAGGQTVTITGTNLGGASAVKFGSMSGTHLHVISSTKLTVRAPRHPAARVNIRVTTRGGTSAITKSDRYTFVARP